MGLAQLEAKQRPKVLKAAVKWKVAQWKSHEKYLAQSDVAFERAKTLLARWARVGDHKKRKEARDKANSHGKWVRGVCCKRRAGDIDTGSLGARKRRKACDGRETQCTAFGA